MKYYGPFSHKKVQPLIFSNRDGDRHAILLSTGSNSGAFASQPGASLLQGKPAKLLERQTLGRIGQISSNVAAVLADKAKDRTIVLSEMTDFGRLLLELAPPSYADIFSPSASFFRGIYVNFKFANSLLPSDFSAIITIFFMQSTFSAESYGAQLQPLSSPFSKEEFEKCLVELATLVKNYEPSGKSAKLIPELAEMRSICLGLHDSASMQNSLSNLASVFERASRDLGVPVRIWQSYSEGAHMLQLCEETIQFNTTQQGFKQALADYNKDMMGHVSFGIADIMSMKKGQYLVNQEYETLRLFRHPLQDGMHLSLYGQIPANVGIAIVQQGGKFEVQELLKNSLAIRGNISSKGNEFWPAVQFLFMLNMARDELGVHPRLPPVF